MAERISADAIAIYENVQRGEPVVVLEVLASHETVYRETFETIDTAVAMLPRIWRDRFVYGAMNEHHGTE